MFLRIEGRRGAPLGVFLGEFPRVSPEAMISEVNPTLV